jgi:hypothetical protein
VTQHLQDEHVLADSSPKGVWATKIQYGHAENLEHCKLGAN